MVRDDAQLSRMCWALLATVRLERLWNDDGPTAEASDLLAADGGPLSSGERIVLLAAWAFWNGAGGVTLADVITHLDGDRMEALGVLMMAFAQGADAIDGWLVEYDRERRTR